MYVGISNNIKKRITTHWSCGKSLERLIFGDVCSSVLSIDSFGALDTTRVFYIKTSNTYRYEDKIIKDLVSHYSLNRTVGGIGSVETYTDEESYLIPTIVANRRKKNLGMFIDAEKLKLIVSNEEYKNYLKRYRSY